MHLIACGGKEKKEREKLFYSVSFGSDQSVSLPKGHSCGTAKFLLRCSSINVFEGWQCSTNDALSTCRKSFLFSSVQLMNHTMQQQVRGFSKAEPYGQQGMMEMTGLHEKVKPLLVLPHLMRDKVSRDFEHKLKLFTLSTPPCAEGRVHSDFLKSTIISLV